MTDAESAPDFETVAAKVEFRQRIEKTANTRVLHYVREHEKGHF